MQEKVEYPRYITDTRTAKKIDLLAWKAANIRYSYILAFFVFALFIAIAYLIAIVSSPESAIFYISIALFLAIGQNIVAYWFGDDIALKVAKARPANKDEERYLVNITEAISFGTGLPMPKIYVMDSDLPNAFATGRNPNHSAIAVSTALLALLDRQELEGVIAHEMSHIKNYDILFLTMLAATVGALVIMRDLFMRSLRYGSRRSNKSDKGQVEAIAYLILLILLILAPILGTMLHLAVSRRREYLADATAVYLTRNPDGLISALEKLAKFKDSGKEAINDGIRHLYFVDPKAFRRQIQGVFATHPLIEDRIERLKSL